MLNYPLLTALVHHLRQTYRQNGEITWNDFSFILSTETAEGQFANEVFGILTSTKWVATIEDSGIGDLGLFSEAKRKISYKILPPEPQPEELFTTINQLFNLPTDPTWVSAIPIEIWQRLLAIFRFHTSKKTERYITKEILNTLNVLAYKVASLGIQDNVVAKIPKVDDLDSPFLGLGREVVNYTEKILHSSYKSAEERQHDWKQIEIMLKQCKKEIASLYELKDVYGISLSLTLQIRKLEKFIERIHQLLTLLENGDQAKKAQTVRSLLATIIDIQTHKYSLTRHFSVNLEFLSFKIVENTSKTGEHYIVQTPKAYWSMFRKALGGGLLVAFLCWLKIEISYEKYPLFWEALLFSLTYAGGFTLIHILKFTLATKQPAMTASTVAASFVSSKKETEWLGKTKNLFTNLLRTQFIALLGNALMAFPAAYAIDQVFLYATGNHIADGIKANAMILELHPLKSLALPHAAIAGVYLMISGLIAGYYENKWTYNNISKRLLANQRINSWMPRPRLEKLVHYLSNNFGAIMGNITLGFFLGSTNAVGKLLGLPLDIRHITFASGNFGLSVSSLENQIDSSIWLWTILGIAGIGIINVIVSFGLSVIIAVKSRNISLSKVWKLSKSLIRQFFTNTGTYFYPTSPNK